VFEAIHAGNPDQKLLSYQYLQMLPEIARGDANKVWIVPSELGKALEGLGSVVGRLAGPDGDARAGTTGGGTTGGATSGGQLTGGSTGPPDTEP
jgi:hypothetical protein